MLLCLCYFVCVFAVFCYAYLCFTSFMYLYIYIYIYIYVFFYYCFLMYIYCYWCLLICSVLFFLTPWWRFRFFLVPPYSIFISSISSISSHPRYRLLAAVSLYPLTLLADAPDLLLHLLTPPVSAPGRCDVVPADALGWRPWKSLKICENQWKSIKRK